MKKTRSGGEELRKPWSIAASQGGLPEGVTWRATGGFSFTIIYNTMGIYFLSTITRAIPHQRNYLTVFLQLQFLCIKRLRKNCHIVLISSIFLISQIRASRQIQAHSHAILFSTKDTTLSKISCFPWGNLWWKIKFKRETKQRNLKVKRKSKRLIFFTYIYSPPFRRAAKSSSPPLETQGRCSWVYLPRPQTRKHLTARGAGLGWWTEGDSPTNTGPGALVLCWRPPWNIILTHIKHACHSPNRRVFSFLKVQKSLDILCMTPLFSLFLLI